MFFETGKKECAHVWIDVCAVFHRRLEIEGIAVLCENCRTLGLKKDNRTIPVDGREVFQAEYGADGRPNEVWDAHL